MMTHADKRARLAALSEDEFRDQVVRELFTAQGFRSYRDVCGIDEEGKDCTMFKDAEFGKRHVYAIQTKTTKLNMSRHATQNVVEAITQLQTAAQTKIACLDTKTKVIPDYVYLCTSGTANSTARAHIADKLAGTNITILDADEIIEAIETYYPSFWINISRYNRRYVETVRSNLLTMSDAVLLHPSDASRTALAPIVEEAYVTLMLYRLTTHLTVRQGKVKTEPQLEELDDRRLLDAAAAIIFVIGDGGTGKTTLLRRLCLLTCDRSLSADGPEECPLPILFRAIDLLHTDDLRGAIEARVRETLKEASSGLVDSDFESGRFRVFIDAMDELGSNTGYHHVFGMVEKFVGAFPKCRVIASSRPLMTVRDYATTNGIPLYQISDFSLKQAGRIVSRALAGKDVEPAAITEVLRRLQDVHGMKLNPLLVTVFAATPNFYTKDIPPNISAIFRKFAALMLGQWDDQKGVSRQYEWEEKHGILSQIALNWHNKRITEKSLAEFRGEVEDILTSWGRGDRADSVTEEILRSGLLIVIEERVSFRHHLFQEYFTGASIESLNDVSGVVADEWWRNAIVFGYGARPTRGDELAVLVRDVDLAKGVSAYRSLVTIGLALQACYQTHVDVRQSILGDVIVKLAGCFAGFLKDQESANEYPLSAFLFHFLEARDSVSSDQILNIDLTLVDEEISEHVAFLRFTGAIESGHINAVKSEVLKFGPKDERMLLALHLLAFFVLHLRVSAAGEKLAAKEIAHAIAPKIQPLLSEVLKEFRGMVMELQKGTIHVLDAPLLTPEGQYEIDFEKA